MPESPLNPPVGRRPGASFAAGVVRAFHAYGTWLAGISWGKFVVLAVLLLIFSDMLQKLPPFSWKYTEQVVVDDDEAPTPPKPPSAPRQARIQIERADPAASGAERGVDIVIGREGVRIRPLPAASAPVPVTAASSASPVDLSQGGVHIVLPPGADAEDVREAIEEVQRELDIAVDEPVTSGGPRKVTHTVHYGESLPDLAFLWILASVVLKITYKGRLQAEVKAAQATETAEAESLKRQVVEARMAAMQAQVEPHFLFNTLASIDHLIETDPPRASQMQKHLIALLRASMPSMRETGEATARDLGRELAVVRPYVEILKVRMEERLDAQIDVPEGLLSAEFPAMMLQTLVENAIRHGLEPKPEGGQLRVRAEIVHGQLRVSVADTGVGFGQAATAGTGVGLANIRERLALLHGGQASLTVAPNPPGGTLVSITVPYRSVGSAPASSSAPAA